MLIEAVGSKTGLDTARAIRFSEPDMPAQSHGNFPRRAAVPSQSRF